ncbi:MAG TPA: ABC transporter ATP-binding protein [Verrucomicrobiales bacterium]|nr:ABC transporter ATP-binding protein [Verrucomicrobiales bacterium]HIL69766.1 ABC transporter ATP-binding protein [Verrucomicrobiota bacterium]
MIEIKNLVKSFADLTAVNDLSLTVPQGEFFCILGPNAAGKTTTIKIITGLMKPTRGSVIVGGFNIVEEPIRARELMAYVPDFPFLYDKLTPLEFFEFIGRMFHMEEERIETQGRELIDRFGLVPYLKKPIESLSHGTRQRVAIVSGLLHDPKVFVIDEPMVGLDPHHARIVKDVFRERCRDGMTVFLSTHQLGVAEEMADRVGIINHGRLVAVGTIDELSKKSGVGGALESSFLELTSQLHENREPCS